MATEREIKRARALLKVTAEKVFELSCWLSDERVARIRQAQRLLEGLDEGEDYRLAYGVTAEAEAAIENLDQLIP